MTNSWFCLIGEVDWAKLPPGADLPMRIAIQKAFHDLTGEWPQFTFSGWGAQPDENQRAVIEAKRK